VREAAIVGSIAFAVLAYAASPAFFWLDSGEIAAAGAELGVMHPPGAPGLVPIMHLATKIPLASLAWRTAMACSFAASLALVVIVRMLAEQGVSLSIRLGAAAWMLCGWTFVRQARVTEVYAWGVLLFVSALWGLQRERTDTHARLLATAAITVASWGFGDLRLALLPALAAVWLAGLTRGHPWARWAPLVVCMFSCVVATLPLAAARGPMASWGEPIDWSALWNHLQARSIRDAFAHEILPSSPALWLYEAGQTTVRLAEDLGPVGLALVLVCLVTRTGWALTSGTAHDRRSHTLLIWIVLTLFSYCTAINPMGGPDRQTGIPLVIVCIVLVALEMDRWLAGRPAVRVVALPVLLLSLLLPSALFSAGDARVTRSWAPHLWTQRSLAQLPPGALLVTQSDDLSAGVLAMRVLEGARPDIVSLPAQHLHHAVPQRANTHARESFAWESAQRGHDESSRVAELVWAWPNAVALELPRTGVLRTVPWWSERGQSPLRVAGLGSELAGAAGSPEHSLDSWSAELVSREDRKRLAIALAGLARASVERHGAHGLAGAQRIYELVLRHVDPDHVSSLVALGAVFDRLGQRELAITLTHRALELEPARHMALVNLALYLSRAPETHEEALELVARAVSLRPWRSDGWLRLAHVHRVAGNLDAAERAEARAEAIGPDQSN